MRLLSALALFIVRSYVMYVVLACIRLHPKIFGRAMKKHFFNISVSEITLVSTSRTIIFGPGGEGEPSGYTFYDIEGTIECMHRLHLSYICTWAA